MNIRYVQALLISAAALSAEGTAPQPDLGVEYHDVSQLLRAARAEAEGITRKARREGEEIKARIEQKKQRIAQLESELISREEARKAALDEHAEGRARELSQEAERKAAEILKKAEKEAAELRKKLAETDKSERAYRPSVTDAWRKRITQECTTDIRFLKNVIAEGEGISNERKEFMSLLDSQLQWFSDRIAKTSAFFDDSYTAIMKRKDRLSLLVDAQRQADVEIDALSMRYAFSDEVKARFRTVTLYELNHYLATNSEHKEGEMALDEVTEIVKSALALLMPERKDIKITTEKERVVALEKKIAELERSVESAHERAERERREQERIAAELADLRIEKERLEYEHAERIRQEVDEVAEPLAARNNALISELKRSEIVRDILSLRAERVSRVWRSAYETQMAEARQYRMIFEDVRGAYEELKKNFEIVQKELTLLSSSAQEEILRRAQEASANHITAVHLEKVVAQKKREKAVLKKKLHALSQELSTVKEQYATVTGRAGRDRRAAQKELSLMQSFLIEKDKHVADLQRAIDVLEQRSDGLQRSVVDKLDSLRLVLESVKTARLEDHELLREVVRNTREELDGLCGKLSLHTNRLAKLKTGATRKLLEQNDAYRLLADRLADQAETLGAVEQVLSEMQEEQALLREKDRVGSVITVLKESNSSLEALEKEGESVGDVTAPVLSAAPAGEAPSDADEHEEPLHEIDEADEPEVHAEDVSAEGLEVPDSLMSDVAAGLSEQVTQEAAAGEAQPSEPLPTEPLVPEPAPLEALPTEGAAPLPPEPNTPPRPAEPDDDTEKKKGVDPLEGDNDLLAPPPPPPLPDF